MLFERLALSKDTKAVMKMAKEGQIMGKPEDAIKDPKDDIFARYVLGGLNNKVFASKYKLTLPSEKELSRNLKLVNLDDKTTLSDQVYRRDAETRRIILA